jgi:LacI family transcriptional regulator
MATIYDVAKEAGVSPKTVSRVLNGDAPVNVQTREAVEAAMARLNYVPSNAARMMRSNRSGLIGLVTGAISMSPELEQPAGLPELFIVQSIQRAIAASGRTLMIADTGGVAGSVPHLVQTFLEHRVEGLIYVAGHHQRVELPPIPVDTPVVLANCFDDAGTPCVIPDDRRGERELVERLIKAGHRRIAYLSLRPDIVATGLRIAGYRDALAASGIPYDDALIDAGEITGPEEDDQLLWNAIDRMLHLAQPPTVMCCGNDKMAMRVYGMLRSRGLKVPDEISVAGYDNYRVIAETLYPPLTTVELPYVAMGVRAAQRLLALISGEGRTHSEPSLVAGPVYWRSSVTELLPANVSKLKIVREDPQ